MTAAATSIFEERTDPGRVLSAVLAAAMHALLFALLVFGVRWQSKPPEAVQVELWNPPAELRPAEEPKPVPKVEPPPALAQAEVAKPEPVLPKPEIVEKKAPAPKPLAKPEPKPVAKAPPKPAAAAAPARPRDEEAQRQIREQLLREQASLQIDRERQQLKDQLARDAAAANSAALAKWKDKVASHIRSRIRVEIAQAVPGNPEAIFDVTILPSYEVLKVSKIKSSGNAAYDDDVERAILKSSPLPRPDKAEMFERALRLTFRPKD